ncbi:MAG: LPXTG cell wall anchor domain-containing protein [Lachnospiraceae bacterium]|nr:LPXTG cell wall anchor domain-containing protein [Lachnospiraceae bacterium]
MRKYIFILASVVGLLAAAPAFAATHQFSAEVDNTITTGDISITLEEYELDDLGNQIPYQDRKTVLPGQKVVKIICIINEAEPAWIRAKAEFVNPSGINSLGEGMLGGISEGWIKQNDYYYYTRPVDTGEEIHFFEEVMIPAVWNENDSGKEFSIDITAQAIQKVHFNPSFDSEDPWFGVPIEACVHTEHERYHAGKNTEFAVIFENGVDGFIKVGNDFFQDFSAMMPGDTMEDFFLIGNKASRPLSIKFRTEVPDDQSTESLKLLSDLLLTINCGKEILYTGPLSADLLKDGILIAASMKQNETEAVTYRIHMPRELQNASAMQHARVRWIFSTEYTESSGGGSSGGGGKDQHPEPSGGAGKFSGSAPEPSDPASIVIVPVIESIRQAIHDALPKTGDESMGNCGFLAVMLVSGSGILFLFPLCYRKKKKAREDLNEG